MLAPSYLEQINPEYRRLRKEYKAIDLKISQVAYNKEDPPIEDPQARSVFLQSLKIDRQALHNKLNSLKGMLERRVVLQSALNAHRGG